MNAKIIISKNHNPYYNLALEEYLINLGENVLYLWQNDNTIVIGRNQNPYKECDIIKVNEDDIHLARRRSGGGTVFHDLGNLNFTLISEKKENNIDENFNVVNEALNSLGIESIFNGRNDIHVNGKKISGNAFYAENNIFCHHGTLLVDVDMSKLSSYITASKLKLKSKGIDSVKSRVINLKEISDEITIDKLNNALINSYSKKYLITDVDYLDKTQMQENMDLVKIVEKYKSWDWIYGESPKSNISFEEKFSWGIIEINFNIENGIIKNCSIYTDSIINDNFTKLSQSLYEEKFIKTYIVDKINITIENENIREDLSSYILNSSI